MYAGKRILGLIPARGGSKGLPGKNVRPLKGKPLIGWTVEAGLNSKHIDRLVLSSDDPEIIAVATRFGCEAPFVRPAHLATDAALAMDVVIDALDRLGAGWDTLVLLQPTSPLRNAVDIDRCIERCIDAGAPSVVTVSPLPKPAGFYGAIDAEGRLVRAGPPTGDAAGRPCMLNGAVYVADIAALRGSGALTGPGTLAELMPFERSFDVDTLYDFLICDLVLTYIAAGNIGELDAVRS